MTNPLKRFLTLSPLKIALIMIVGLLTFYVVGPPAMEQLELKALDLRFKARGPVKPGPEVVIATVDEKSVKELGRWPWPRSEFATLVDNLSKDGAKAIAFDIGFLEPDPNNEVDLIRRLQRAIDRVGVKSKELAEVMKKESEEADHDGILARSIKNSRSPVVLGYFFHMVKDESVAHITPEGFKQRLENLPRGHYTFIKTGKTDLDPRKSLFTSAYVPETNIPELVASAQSAGYFNMFPDQDGTVRWVPMTIQFQDRFYMPLSLEALRLYKGAPSSVNLSDVGVDKITVGDLEVPVDELGRLLVNYRGPQKQFPHYSISDINKGKLPTGTFKDRIVLVGPTAVGIYDLRVTPFDSVFPGVEIHANVIDNVLHRDYLVRPGWTAILDFLTIIVMGLILGLVLPKLSALTGPLLGLGLITAWTGANYYLFLKGLWINLVFPVLTVVLIYSAITVYRYMTEEREKRKIKGAFNYYVNPSVVSEMLKNPDMLKLGGDKRMMTVLFSDIRGFTTISEKLDPEALVHLLNQYLTAMTDVVFKYDGLLDKYIGDAIMAFWGAPLSQPQHAVLACRTSLEMLTELKRLRHAWAEQDPHTPFIDIGIGLNTGPMVVGNMGSQTRFDYTVMGDSVNLGSRLEGANKQYGTNIIIGEVTFEQVKDQFYCRELDAVAVKGKALPVRIYELVGLADQVSPEKIKMMRAFSLGLTAYKGRRWEEAQKIFSAVSEHYPEDKPTRLYMERVADLRQNPPPDNWDGVYVMKTK